MNKRYVAINRSSLILIAKLPENKGQLSIEFQSGYGMKKEAYFITNNKEIQDVLESDKRFNESYRLEEIDNINVVEYEFLQTQKESVVNDSNAIEKMPFNNINDARDFLANEPYNIERNKLNNPKSILNRAKELGFEFEILNNNF